MTESSKTAIWFAATGMMLVQIIGFCLTEDRAFLYAFSLTYLAYFFLRLVLHVKGIWPKY